jgi:uncharacterized membrane protein
LDSIPIPDFRVGVTTPSITLADGTTLATSTILVSPINGFTGTVALSDLLLPIDLSCTEIDPAIIPKSSGMAMVSCSSLVARTYDLTIIGASGGIRHNATATFTFVTSASPDFRISAMTPISFTSGSTINTSVGVTPLGGFDSQVNLAATVYPNIGFSISLEPQSLDFGFGMSTATFSSSTPGDYTVKIMGTSGSLSHTATVVVAVTLAGMPDFGISASSGSISIEAGNPGATRITITSSNGFTGPITLSLTTPADISCSLSPTSVESSGEITLTCNGIRAGDYSVTIRATGTAGLHSTTVNVHVDAVSPAVPAPSTSPRFSPNVVYGIVGAIIIVVVAGTVLSLRRSRRHES